LDIRSLVENGFQDVVSIGVADIVGHIELINKKVISHSGGGSSEVETKWAEISGEVISIERDFVSVENSSSGTNDGGNANREESIDIEDTKVPFKGIDGFSGGSSSEDGTSDGESVFDGNGKRESEAVVESSSFDEMEFSDSIISLVTSEVSSTGSSEIEADITFDMTTVSKSSKSTNSSSV